MCRLPYSARSYLCASGRIDFSGEGRSRASWARGSLMNLRMYVEMGNFRVGGPRLQSCLVSRSCTPSVFSSTGGEFHDLKLLFPLALGERVAGETVAFR